jgi:hypothetical protein
MSEPSGLTVRILEHEFSRETSSFYWLGSKRIHKRNFWHKSVGIISPPVSVRRTASGRAVSVRPERLNCYTPPFETEGEARAAAKAAIQAFADHVANEVDSYPAIKTEIKCKP